MMKIFKIFELNFVLIINSKGGARDAHYKYEHMRSIQIQMYITRQVSANTISFPSQTMIVCALIVGAMTVADLRGTARDAPPGGQNSFIFTQFLAQKIGSHTHWIRH